MEGQPVSGLRERERKGGREREGRRKERRGKIEGGMEGRRKKRGKVFLFSAGSRSMFASSELHCRGNREGQQFLCTAVY